MPHLPACLVSLEAKQWENENRSGVGILTLHLPFWLMLQGGANKIWYTYALRHSFCSVRVWFTVYFHPTGSLLPNKTLQKQQWLQFCSGSTLHSPGPCVTATVLVLIRSCNSAYQKETPCCGLFMLIRLIQQWRIKLPIQWIVLLFLTSAFFTGNGQRTQTVCLHGLPRSANVLAAGI